MSDMVTIAARLGLYLDLMLLFGLPMFGLYTLRGGERASGSVLRFRSVLATTALAGVGLSMLGMMVRAASISGLPINQVDRATVNLLISSTMCGRPPRRKSFSALMTSVGCIHVFGLFAQHRMAAGPDEVRRLAP